MARLIAVLDRFVEIDGSTQAGDGERVAAMFARAWRRPQFGGLEKFVRGVVWFALYLETMSAHERIGWAGDHGAGLRVALLTWASTNSLHTAPEAGPGVEAGRLGGHRQPATFDAIYRVAKARGGHVEF